MTHDDIKTTYRSASGYLSSDFGSLIADITRLDSEPEDQVAALKHARIELQRRADMRVRMLVLEALHRAHLRLAPPDEPNPEAALATVALTVFQVLADVQSFTDEPNVWAALAKAWLIRPGAPHKAKTRRNTGTRPTKWDQLAKLIGDHVRDRTHVAGSTLKKQWIAWKRGRGHMK